MPVLQFLSLLRSTSTTSSAPYATLALLLSKNRSAPLRLARNRLAPSTPKKPPCLLPLRLRRQLRNAASCLSSPHRAPPPSRPGHPRHGPRLCPASRPTSPPCRLCSTTPSQRRLPRPRAAVARRPAFVSLCPRPADPRRRDVVAGGEEEVGETAGAGGGRGEAGPARAEHEDEDITSFPPVCLAAMDGGARAHRAEHGEHDSGPHLPQHDEHHTRLASAIKTHRKPTTIIPSHCHPYAPPTSPPWSSRRAPHRHPFCTTPAQIEHASAPPPPSQLAHHFLEGLPAPSTLPTVRGAHRQGCPSPQWLHSFSSN